MSFWSKEVTAETKDPKRNFRFIVTFAGIGEDNQSQIWYAKKVDKPNFSVTESTHSYMDKTYYWPGRLEWQKITMSLVDPVSPNVAEKMAELIENAGYTFSADLEKSRITMSKSKFATAMGAGDGNIGNVVIAQLDSSGDLSNAVETWTLKNAWVSVMKFGSLDYESDDLTELELELRYDWAEMNAAGKKHFNAGGNSQ